MRHTTAIAITASLLLISSGAHANDMLHIHGNTMPGQQPIFDQPNMIPGGDFMGGPAHVNMPGSGSMTDFRASAPVPGAVAPRTAVKPKSSTNFDQFRTTNTLGTADELIPGGDQIGGPARVDLVKPTAPVVSRPITNMPTISGTPRPAIANRPVAAPVSQPNPAIANTRDPAVLVAPATDTLSPAQIHNTAVQNRAAYVSARESGADHNTLVNLHNEYEKSRRAYEAIRDESFAATPKASFKAMAPAQAKAAMKQRAAAATKARKKRFDAWDRQQAAKERKAMSLFDR